MRLHGALLYMRIKKLSHCCMIVDVVVSDGAERRILIDPGSYSIDRHDKISHADIVLITHEHADHFHIESLKALIKRAPQAIVVANDAVGEILAREGVAHRVMRQGDTVELLGVVIAAHGTLHASMHSTIPQVSNIGYFISGDASGRSLFFPGDAFTDPSCAVDVLALPVAGPWMKLSEAIDYALHIKPRLAFPVHDAIRSASQHLLPQRILGANGIEFIALEEDKHIDL